MPGQLLKVTEAPTALDAPLGNLCDESAAPAMAGCALEPEIAIERQKPRALLGNADIAFAENVNAWSSMRACPRPFAIGISRPSRLPLDALDKIRSHVPLKRLTIGRIRRSPNDVIEPHSLSITAGTRDNRVGHAGALMARSTVTLSYHL